MAMKRYVSDAITEAFKGDDTDTGPAVFLALKWPTEKPAAMVTIDDRALTFDGTWPTIDVLKAFKPWNKK